MTKMERDVLIAILAIGSGGLGGGFALAEGGGQKPFETERVIVKYRSSSVMSLLGRVSIATALSQAFGSENVQYVREMSGGAHVLRVKKTSGLFATTLMALSQQPEVEYIVPDRIMQPVMIPNDNLYSQQWDFFEETGGVNIPVAWDITTGSATTRVGVVDTGYRPHVDLVDNILPGYDFISDPFVANDGDGREADAQDPGDWLTAGVCGGGFPPKDGNSSWHGTHVSGTIAAKTNNEIGVAGIASGTKIVPIRVLGKCGGYSSDILDGMRWAAGLSVPGVPDNPNPVRIINMSLGGYGPCDAAYESAIRDVNARGTVVVVAAGNSNDDASNFTPAGCSDAVTVAATDRTGGRAGYSNFGDVVDIAAPGGDTKTGPANGILSTVNAGAQAPGEDAYAVYQGTSMAAPHISGVAALMLSANPHLTADMVAALLKQSARAFPLSGTIACSVDVCGRGLVDATAAVKAALKGVVDPTPVDIVLENGVPKTGLSAKQRQWLRYTFVVSGEVKKLRVEIRDGAGDADLFVKQGSPASRSSYDLKSENIGNQDMVEFVNPRLGTYHVGVYGYNAFTGLTVVASVE